MSIITETHTVNQRPLKLRRSLRDILHRQSRHKEDALNPPLPHLPFQDIDDTKEYVFDVLFECQRGLLQFDPNPWCDRNMRFTPMNIEDFQLPDPSWQWVRRYFQRLSVYDSLFY
ncbi:hypothetical protein BDB01DRAFT_720901 [Pilobolus umbonatus]|nr:hypothetical protein BDB01DRAFT_720901 [Pilobolus umbonatus]